MTFISKTRASMQSGFSLIELMVGMVIGLLATLAITQAMSVFEGQKRGTTGTADAQTSGSIALYNIGRELKVAGYPLMPSGQAGVVDSPLECTTFSYNLSGVTSITPVSITNGVASAGVNASDTITINYGTGTAGGSPTTLISHIGTQARVLNNFGCQVDDVVLMADGNNCVFSRATAITNTADPYYVTLAQDVSVDGSSFSCLGTWNSVTYRVNNGNLERNGTAVVADIVNLQAQYGISASASSNTIVQWVEPTGATWAAPTVANRNLIKAVRLAIVARNPQIETAAVSTACNAANFTGICAWQDVPASTATNPSPITTASPAPVINLSSADANWARYHYRVFETIIPLRNVVWSKETL